MTRWISLHVFYAGDLDRLLSECVAPLVAELRTRGQIDGWFFVRYWLGGPHVRLRLRGAPGVAEARVRETAEAAVAAFFTRWPAMFETDALAFGRFSRRMFAAEYGEQELHQRYGDAPIPSLPADSVQAIPYEPELERYGGAAGVAAAEAHFEASSDEVLERLRDGNAHVRGVLMGQGLRLMLPLVYAFLEEEPRLATFFARYAAFWRKAYGTDDHPSFETKYRSMAARLQDVVRVAGRPGESAADGRWRRHVDMFRAQIVALLRARQLEIPPGYDDEPAALAYLLGSYVHMTSNRLGLAVSDEVYLCYLARRAVEERVVDHV